MSSICIRMRMYTDMDRSVKEAVEIAVDREEGWSSGGENSDGGAPVPVVQQPSPQVKKSMKSQAWQRNNPVASTSRDSRGPWKPEASSQSSGGWGTSNNQWGGGPSQLNAASDAFSTMLTKLVRTSLSQSPDMSQNFCTSQDFHTLQLTFE